MSEMTALLVEDLEEMRRSYAWHLKEQNIRVLEASDKDSAIKIYKKWASHISVVLTDWRLVDSNAEDNGGIELAKEIKKLNPEQPIICMTAYHRPEELAGSDIFDKFYEKSPSDDSDGFVPNIPNIINFSKEKEKCAKQKTPQGLLNLKEKYRISDQDFHFLVQNRPLTPSIEKALLAFHVSSEIDFDKQSDINDCIGMPLIINPNDSRFKGSELLASPLIVVTKNQEEFVVAELYGHPMIYTYGASQKESISLLIDLLQEYFSDLNSGESDMTNDVVKFSNYLSELLGK